MAKPFSRKILKIISILTGGILILLLCFHFWFVNHAEELIEEMVSSQSKGKIHLKVKKFKFNWFSKKMELQQADFYSPDSASKLVAYRFEVDKLKIQVHAVWPILLEKTFIIDSLDLINPHVSVTRMAYSKDTSTKDKGFSIPQEMGRIYNSIQDALQVLKVERFQINNGTFSLINRARDEPPVVINRLFFHLDNLQVDSSKGTSDQKILFSDNVSLQTTNQSIDLPDGRHHLSFANFRINIRKRLVEFDSCTIRASKGDSARSAFKIFFDKLQLTNIDFDTLYHSEVIKADSVYCINPKFQLNVELGKRKGLVKPPPLNELIQQLTGDLQLAFVVVQNAAFDINTIREGRPSSFTSNNNNFELQSLRIQQNSPQPLTVERFAMAIRNYENFLRDSAFAIRFDSILFNNKRISLSNFSYEELDQNKVVNRLVMPQFELYGLSWDELIFDQKLRAERITLDHPRINFDLGFREGRKKQDIFQSVSSLGQLLELNDLNIVDGEINMLFRNKANLKLQNATVLIHTKDLVAAKAYSGIKNSLSLLTFKKGLFKMKGLEASFDNVNFDGKTSRLKSSSAKIRSKNLLLDAKDVGIRQLSLNGNSTVLLVDGLNWSQASLKTSTPSESATNQSTGKIQLKNFSGNNTIVDINNKEKQVSLKLDRITGTEFNNIDGITVNGLVANGNNLKIAENKSSIVVESFNINDGKNSSFRNTVYKNEDEFNNSTATIPEINFTANLNSILNGKMKLSEVEFKKPSFNINKNNSDQAKTIKPNKLPSIEIGKLGITDPFFEINSSNANGSSFFSWDGKNNNRIDLSGIKLNADSSNRIEVEQLSFLMDHVAFKNEKKSFNTGEGKLKATVSNIGLSRDEEGTWDWNGKVNNLEASDFQLDSLGKKSGTLTIKSGKLNDLSIGSGSLLNLRTLVKNNKEFRLTDLTGDYSDSKSQYKWYNAGYDKRQHVFRVDSVSYRPTQELETFVKNLDFQTDYLTGRSGSIIIGPFDIDRYIEDSIMEMGTITVNNFVLTDFRDKQVPRKPGDETLLLVKKLQRIPVRFFVDSVKINNAFVDYAETNEKSSKVGRITVNRLNGRATRVRNFDMGPNDSLDMRFTGFLQDRIFTKLSVKQSYTDSLGGFLVTEQMSSADLTILNPVLRPLVNVELSSGRLDSMQMRVAGNDRWAYGDMKMYYHDLKVKVINRDELHKSFLTGLKNFVANTVIKNQNTEKTSKVFFKRLRDRSNINYLVKITLSGFASSVGLKSNRKQVRKHRKETRKLNLPEIETSY